MSTQINDDRILDVRDMQEEIREARETERPLTFITAEQARNAVKPMSSYDVFQLIASQAASGYTEVFITYDRIGPETMELLGAGGYRVRLGGVANDQAVISWAEEAEQIEKV